MRIIIAYRRHSPIIFSCFHFDKWLFYSFSAVPRCGFRIAHCAKVRMKKKLVSKTKTDRAFHSSCSRRARNFRPESMAGESAIQTSAVCWNAMGWMLSVRTGIESATAIRLTFKNGLEFMWSYFPWTRFRGPFKFDRGEVAVGKALREGINETKLPLMIRNRAREFRSGSPLNSVHLSIS